MTSENEWLTPGAPGWAIFVDFDGTISELDTFDVLVRNFSGDEAWHASERGLHDGTLSLRAVLQIQASHVRGEIAEVAALLRRLVPLDPSFAPFAAECRTREIPLTVVSSGLEPIIRGRLEEIGFGDLPVIANGVEVAPSGWKMHFRDDVDNGTDKAAVIAAANAAGFRTIFIGDGRSDFEAALRADICFAKRGFNLERYLRERGAPHRTFDSFADIHQSLQEASVFPTPAR